MLRETLDIVFKNNYNIRGERKRILKLIFCIKMFVVS